MGSNITAGTLSVESAPDGLLEEQELKKEETMRNKNNQNEIVLTCSGLCETDFKHDSTYSFIQK